MPAMHSKAAGSIVGDTWATWNTLRKASLCFEEVWIRSQMDISALTFLSWAVTSAEGWSFLVEEEVGLVVGSSVEGLVG